MSITEAGRPLELWGGVECTVTRVGEDFRDQLRETGHWDRPGDLDLVAGLGIRVLRYPVLWEHVSPAQPDRADWSWHDARLARLRDLGVTPVAGLVHHGGGPRYTDLADPAFPEKLAVHAARVAERYPWLRLFTPVNEPLTTARFAGLYGHWYPHGTGYGPFLRALAIECKGVLLSMRAIRRRIPDARLVQTEDMGKCFSTPCLRHQAEHENERRWLSLDLLCGRVGRSHPWHAWFLEAGAPEADLDLLATGEATPDIVGINHYTTSERYLDPAQHHYPEHLRSADPRHAYADAEAVRMDWPVGETGPAARLREVWERYRLPLAVTEAHHGSTREEQLRWLLEVWQAAQGLRAEGADIRAVTVWSLFGALDWNSLLRERAGFYEPGPFDARHDPPRPTALAAAAKALATTGTFDHPVLDRAGWWHRPDRCYHPPAEAADRLPCAASPRRLLLVAEGAAAEDLSRLCQARGLDHVLAPPDLARVTEALTTHGPWGLVQAGGPAGLLAGVDGMAGVPLLLLTPDARGAPPPGALLVRPEEDANLALDLLVDGEAGIWRGHDRAFAPPPRLADAAD